MAPPPENRHQYRGEIEVEMNNGPRNGTHFRDFVPVEISPTPNGNYRTGPTIESMPSDPSHDHDHRPPPIFIRFVRWLQAPMNLALFLWLIPVVSGLLVQLLLMTGALDHATKTKERKKIWTEVDNQILNAFFTLGCFFSHTEVFYHLLFAIRWRPEDEVSIRSIYCKNRTPNPRDRRHLLFVACLINLTWVGQYIMCGLYWAFNRHNRPSGFLTFWVIITLVAPIVAYFYTAKGPLKADKIEEGGQAVHLPIVTPESKLRMYNGGVMVTRPEWDGGLFGCCDDTTVGCSAFFCPFYAFGKNMNKLGFGPRNLHIVTFVIAVFTPFVVFYITSLKIHSHAIKIVLWTTGGLLSWVGFLYGGYWRIRMREKYNLPENSFCFGVPFLTDYFQWLFCAPCSLAQEIRTANSYDIEEPTDEMAPIPREVSMRRLESNRSFSSPPKFGPSDALHSRQASVDDRPIEMSAFGRSSTASRVHAMAPPHPPAM